MYCIVEWDCGHYYASTVALAVLFSIAVVIIIVLLVLLCRKRDKNRSYNVSLLFVYTNSFTLQSSKLGQKCNILQRYGMTSFLIGWRIDSIYIMSKIAHTGVWDPAAPASSLTSFSIYCPPFLCGLLTDIGAAYLVIESKFLSRDTLAVSIALSSTPAYIMSSLLA